MSRRLHWIVWWTCFVIACGLAAAMVILTQGA